MKITKVKPSDYVLRDYKCCDCGWERYKCTKARDMYIIDFKYNVVYICSSCAEKLYGKLDKKLFSTYKEF